MLFYSYAVLTVLFLVGLACAVLPFMAVWERRLAVMRRRSLYDKSAGQVETLAAFLQLAFALALGADLFASGHIHRMMSGPWLFLWECLVITSAVSGLFAVGGLFARGGVRMFLYILSGLVSVLAASLLCIFGWAFCLGALNASVEGMEQSVQAFMIVMAGTCSLGFMLFVLFSVCLAATSAYGAALCWHILCRNRDDFGRDYYTFVLTMRAWQAFCSCILLLLGTAALFWMNPVMDPAQGLALLPVAHEYAVAALSGGILCLPVAMLLWYGISKTAVPMQKKSFAFLALLLLGVGVYCMLGRL